MSEPVDFRVVIPARYASTRLPGKPLVQIAGKPMIQHVWERAVECGPREVLVATDDTRIADAVQAFGGRAVMTSPDHVSGTDRLAEVATREGWSEDTIVVNLQGDEPLTHGPLLRRMATALAENPDAQLGTVASTAVDPADAVNPNVVKVVLDQRSFALYFSRAPIPWKRGGFAWGEKPDSLPEGGMLRHLGLYAYRVGSLRKLAAAPAPALERAESLEQLRALYLGMRIHVTVIDGAHSQGVDVPEDVAVVERMLRELAQTQK